MRELARDVALVVADRITSPQRVAEFAATYPSTVRDTGVPHSPVSLVDGHPGIVLLLAHLDAHDSSERLHATHRHLSAATSALQQATERPCLFYGLPALAFATHLAAAGTANYASLLAQLDERVSEVTRDLLRTDAQGDRDDPLSGTRPDPTHDLIFGLSGLGRYLLLRLDKHAEVAAAVVTRLARYAVDLLDAPIDPRDKERDEVLVGAAHGLAGILSLLALAHRAGVVVPDHDTAIRRIADTLVSWRCPDDTTLCWPYSMQWHPETATYVPKLPSTRPAWCNGASGVITALAHAGRALNVERWTGCAVEAAEVICRQEPHTWRMSTIGLCHGYSGALQLLLRLAQLTGCHSFDATIRLLIERILEFHDPSAPFAFHRPGANQSLVPEGPGFIDGAVGTALALISYAIGLPEPDQPAWDSALLLS
ncbi:hypothetical protein GCM10012275_19710 [Longimycelium tulufanense]|uniref:Uncharacterized protein n=1 Tax=Longimycelium tulufanense TaxID=907463 RepID=A0A8J3CCS9_9PSEU|nr:lanthionine synthetase LanC family protein [Longimycelium tulufanense]GGM48860.1 hypothetical protein GCM10012275_19710 [Longimycelium tulufanense]